MHLLDIATGYRNNVFAVTSQKLFCNTRFVYGKDTGFPSSWRSFCIPGEAKGLGGLKLPRGGLMIRAVATFQEVVTKSNQSSEKDCYEGCVKLSIESRSLECTAMEQQSETGNSTELDESVRQMRVPKSNKGRVPWNKGRKHSPETLQRIRERTRLAMQDPKVKMKLANLGHAQSGETRMKIGASMQLNWEKRRKKLMLQETCYFEWQNLLAEASRNGLFGEEELQWGSYKILNEQLEQEWLQSVQQRKKKPMGSKNQPKSAEQRRKISEAIAAKWADPEYRNRVCSAIAKQRGVPDGVERKKRKRPSSNGQTRKRSPSTKKDDINGLALNKPKSQTQQVRLDRSSIPKYMDPLASSKLEMLKNIRTQRAAIDNKKDEALARAKLLIAEAEKAAKALEIAATKSPVAKASLIESRELIAEAIRYIESIDIGDVYSVENGTEYSLTPTEPASVDDMTLTKLETLEEVDQRKSNRAHALLPNGDGIHNFKSTGKHLHPLLNGKGAAFLSSLSDYDSLGCKEKLGLTFSSNMAPLAADAGLRKLDTAEEVDGDHKRSEVEEGKQKPWPNGFTSQPISNPPPPAKPTAVSKKWVRGRFVEAAEEDGGEK
ncbi:PREDICTED: uncharacterized protein LOC109187488 [Ipomoea nil]|uniref:uncharacterized protein LOC109187488 n=1 Tax=Ipomoea nil TaxID=35883 RepID=UPI000900ECCB|nr:PREDICTED: uncharacterized protein LOC109187488 [Ipomoea nil]